MTDVLILGGCGMQGKIVARDLLENGKSIVIGDMQRESAQKFFEKYPDVPFEKINLQHIYATVDLIKKVKPKIVVNCAEGDWDLNVYKAALEAGVHVIDLGSTIPMTKKQLAMGPFFKMEGLTAITGCGSTPGINNVALHIAHSMLDTIHSVEAGFVWDSNIKEFVVPFSIMSVIYEFKEPAPYIEDSVWKKANPLDTVDVREFREIGKQKIFLVRHPETYTFFLYNQNDGMKNVKYFAGFPDHSFNKIVEFIETGQGDDEEYTCTVDGKQMTPLEKLSWDLRTSQFPPGYTEKENLWVIARGTKDGKSKEIIMETIVNTLPTWEDAGCNIDTGMPASIIAQMILDGRISRRGSFAPGPVVTADEFLKELRKRQMIMYCNGQPIN
jgi:lysine 6-dehydrogenase